MWGRFLFRGAYYPSRVAAAAGGLHAAWTNRGPGSADSCVACAPERRIEDVYDLLDNRPIGMGGFGVVCPGQHRETGEIVAIKSVSKRTMSKQRMHREADIMQLGGDHRCVVSYVDLFESPSHYYLVMEMASGGEVFDRLVARGAYTEASAAKLVGELAEALAYLHANGVVHFDIKPENILLHSSDSSDSNVAVHAHYGDELGAANKNDSSSSLPETTRVTDFGSAFLLSAPAPERTPKPGSGTSAYLPPEALVEDVKKRQPCTEKADMWSLGVVMYILLAGAHPFDLENRASDQEIERRIREDEPKLKGGAWERVSPEGKALLAQLLQKDPTKRPSAAELLTHPWMTGGAAANEAPLEDVHANLRAFGRARRRLKALLLATMLGLDKRFTTAAPAFLDSSSSSSEATAADLAAAAASIQTGHPLSTAASTAQVGYLAGELARRSTTMAGPSAEGLSNDVLNRKDSTQRSGGKKATADLHSTEATNDFFRVRRHATTAEPGEFDEGSSGAVPQPKVANSGSSSNSGSGSRSSSTGGGMRRRNTAQPLPEMDGSGKEESQAAAPQPPMSGEVEDPMGSRKQALRLFDRGKKGYISHADLVRLLRKIDVHNLSDAEVDEMIRAADANPRGKQTTCLPEQLLKLVPPLCPARVVDPGGLVFKSGEIDPQAYLLTQGEVVLTLDPRRGGAPLEALRFKRGDLVGDAELTLSPDGAPNVLQRLWTARCVEDPPKEGAAPTNGPSGCRLLAVRRELFSHLTDVFEPLGNGLATRAQAQLQATLHHWINACEHATPLEAHQRGATLWPPTSANSKHTPAATSALRNTHSAAVAWSGCLLVVSEGAAEVDVLSDDPHDHSSSGESDGGGSTVTTKTVGPGFLCYCPPVKTKHSWLGQKMLAADVNDQIGTSNKSDSVGAVTNLASVYDMAKIPPSLQALPRCVGARVAPKRSTGHSGDRGDGGSRANADSSGRVVVTVVPGKDLHELLRQPGMQPLRQYIGKQSTLPASHWRK